jgi:hypothetical protein
MIFQHPSIAECAVLGTPDETYGETVAAVIVGRSDSEGEAVQTEEVQEWARGHLAPYKASRTNLHFPSFTSHFDAPGLDFRSPQELAYRGPDHFGR